MLIGPIPQLPHALRLTWKTRMCMDQDVDQVPLLRTDANGNVAAW
jgi:hypothetical protein